MKISAPELKIRSEIAENGFITFARFMDIALYNHDGGYYTNTFHRPYVDDFYTSPVTHPAFGALIAIQIFQFWKILGSPKNFTIVELGSGRGELAKVIKTTSRELAYDFYDSIKYIEFDKLSGQNFEQNQKSQKEITGCILSNELIDSFPVHRFEMTEDGPKEICITIGDDGKLAEVLHDPSKNEILSYIQSLGDTIKTGSKGEVNLEVNTWGEMISRILLKGFVLTIDYGYEKDELTEENFSSGTLQTHRSHCNGLEAICKIGETDITSDVNFSYLQSITKKYGFNTLQITPQKQFLESMGFHNLIHRLRLSSVSRLQLMQNQMSMLELINPQGFGRFKVLIQEKNTGVGNKNLEDAKTNFATDCIDVPLMDESNINLLGSKYPHATWQPSTYETFDS